MSKKQDLIDALHAEAIALAYSPSDTTEHKKTRDALIAFLEDMPDFGDAAGEVAQQQSSEA